jgi:hypothetical protein
MIATQPHDSQSANLGNTSHNRPDLQVRPLEVYGPIG